MQLCIYTVAYAGSVEPTSCNRGKSLPTQKNMELPAFDKNMLQLHVNRRKVRDNVLMLLFHVQRGEGGISKILHVLEVVSTFIIFPRYNGCTWLIVKGMRVCG